MRKQLLVLNVCKGIRITDISRVLILKISLILLLFWIFLTCDSFTYAQSHKIRSPNGKYEATLIGKLPDLHYQVKEIKTDSVLFTTHAQYITPNNVKVGLFSLDSKKFAAAYHYSGPYTWVGVWEVKTGEFLYSKKKPGFRYDISWIFKEIPSNISPDGRYEASLVGTFPDIHYQVKEIKTDSVLFKTRAEYPTENDVKDGLFSSDSKEFAAAYHYAHKGEKYTWIGIWNIETAKIDTTIKEDGFIEIIPDHVFNK